MCLFSCSMWDLVPWWGIEPGPPGLGVRSLSHWTTREVPPYELKLTQLYVIVTSIRSQPRLPPPLGLLWPQWTAPHLSQCQGYFLTHSFSSTTSFKDLQQILFPTDSVVPSFPPNFLPLLGGPPDFPHGFIHTVLTHFPFAGLVLPKQ